MQRVLIACGNGLYPPASCFRGVCQASSCAVISRECVVLHTQGRRGSLLLWLDLACVVLHLHGRARTSLTEILNPPANASPIGLLPRRICSAAVLFVARGEARSPPPQPRLPAASTADRSGSHGGCLESGASSPPGGRVEGQPAPYCRRRHCVPPVWRCELALPSTGPIEYLFERFPTASSQSFVPNARFVDIVLINFYAFPTPDPYSALPPSTVAPPPLHPPPRNGGPEERGVVRIGSDGQGNVP